MRRLFFSTDGVNFADVATFTHNNNGATVPPFNPTSVVDLSAQAATDNQSTLTLRVVSAFTSGCFDLHVVEHGIR